MIRKLNLLDWISSLSNYIILGRIWNDKRKLDLCIYCTWFVCIISDASLSFIDMRETGFSILGWNLWFTFERTFRPFRWGKYFIHYYYCVNYALLSCFVSWEINVNIMNCLKVRLCKILMLLGLHYWCLSITEGCMYLHDCIPDYQFGVCLTNYRIIHFQVNVSWLLYAHY